MGQERYQFDIWGDTVNVAARIASKGRNGGVAVTERILNQISRDFEGERLGNLGLKGKDTLSAMEIRAEKGKGKSVANGL